MRAVQNVLIYVQKRFLVCFFSKILTAAQKSFRKSNVLRNLVLKIFKIFCTTYKKPRSEPGGLCEIFIISLFRFATDSIFKGVQGANFSNVIYRAKLFCFSGRAQIGLFFQYRGKGYLQCHSIIISDLNFIKGTFGVIVQ